MSTYSKLMIFALLISLSACGQSRKEKAQFINYKAIKKFPDPKSYVNDYENILDDNQIYILDSLINDFEKRTTNQIAIITVDSFDPYESLKDFTTDLGNFWGVGDKEKDNGLIMSVSLSKRKIWIGTGYGTEKVLTEDILQNIIDTVIIPHFKDGDYYEGIKSGLVSCMQSWD